MKNFLPVVIALSLTACASHAPKGANGSAELDVPVPKEVSEKMLTLLEDKAPSDETLTRCIEHCGAADANLARAMRESLRQQKARARGEAVSDADAEAVMKQMSEAGEAWFAGHKDSKEGAEAVAAYQLALMLRGGNAKDASDLREGIAKLPERFPRQPRAHYLYGEMIERDGGAVETAVKSYKTCLELDPSDAFCSRGYKAAVARFEAADCPGTELDPTFGFFLSSSSHDGKHPDRLSGLKVDVFVERESRLGRGDVASVAVVPASTEAGRLEQIRLELTPEGKAKLAAFTRDHLGQDMAVAVKRKALLNARILSPVTEGSLMITMGTAPGADRSAGKLFKAMCRKPRARKLPRELVLDTRAGRG